MVWDDILFGVLTGGLYNAGKALYEGGEALGEAGEAAEQAGVTLAIIGSTVETMGKQLTSLLEELEELVTINRLTPRDESDLWEEEKERLDDLKKKKSQLKNELASLGVTEPQDFSFDFFDFLSDPSNMLIKLQLISQLVAVEKEIHELLYQEPGVATTAIYNAKEVLERFNTIEQPKVEDILDSLDDNLDVSEEVLQEIKKLFVVKKKTPINVSELPQVQKTKLDNLELNKKYYQDLIERKSTISNQLLNAIDKIPAKKFEIDEKTIKIAGLEKTGFKYTGMSENANIGRYNLGEKESDSTNRNNPVDPENVNINNTNNPENEKNRKYNYNIESSEGIDANRFDSLRKLNFTLAKNNNFSPKNIQPQGARVSALLNTKFDGYQRNYEVYKAHLAFYDREIFKIERNIDKIKYHWEDEPGVIPRTLDEIEGILKRVRTQEQPRIENTLDTLNDNLEESKSLLSRMNSIFEPVQSAFASAGKHSKLIMIGAGVFGLVVFLNLVFSLVVLIRMAFGF
jgi:hypothetical protein